MAFTYTNRRGNVFYLQKNEKKGHGSGYSFTTKTPGKPLNQLPKGMEVYEDPNTTQVFLRRIKKSLFRRAERELLEAAVRDRAKGRDFIVDDHGNTLIVYISDLDREGLGPADEYLVRTARFSKMMRFTLTDEKARLFSAERWSFLGSIDNWILLDSDKPLAKLVEKYVRHLGKESFYNLA